jgi:DNA-binding transcriptional MerR regulator
VTRQEPVNEQQALFAADDDPVAADDVGYLGKTAMDAADISYRQLDYWARTGLVVPSVRPASGSGSQRLYSFRDILVLKMVKRLLDLGISLHNIKAAIAYLRDMGVQDLSSVTLISDGASVYKMTSADELIDILAGGQGVFAIAVGKVALETRGRLATLPSERIVEENDELAKRRRKRASGD